MPTGAITGYIDVAQVTLYVFFAFFIALVWYLRQEDKREGYPLDSDRSGPVTVQGLPPVPSSKTFLLRDGHTYQAPPGNPPDRRTISAIPAAAWPGAPLRPAGNPMTDAVGPGAYAERADVPDMTAEGETMLAPLRLATDFFVEARDPDPRGMAVMGADGRVAGTVSDLWIDRSEPQIRYLEVAVDGAGAAGGLRKVLVPMPLARINGKRREVSVESITAAQFADAPVLANPDQITLLEEDRVVAYFGGGTLYAKPSRTEPIL